MRGAFSKWSRGNSTRKQFRSQGMIKQEAMKRTRERGLITAFWLLNQSPASLRFSNFEIKQEAMKPGTSRRSKLAKHQNARRATCFVAAKADGFSRLPGFLPQKVRARSGFEKAAPLKPY